MARADDNKKVKTKSAHRETAEIIFWYLFASLSYVLISDGIVNTMVTDPILNQQIQSIKGFSSLFLIGIIFYLIVLYRIKLYLDTNTRLGYVLEELRHKNDTLAQLESHHYQLAYFDPLTGLINKHKLEQKVNQLIDKNIPFSLMYIDIDDFGVINELKGHIWGDHSLFEIANELLNITIGHVAARMSEDGFVVVMEKIDKEAVSLFAEKILNAIKKMMKEQSQAYFYTASAGIASFPSQGNTYHDILRYADLALSLAKKNGKDQFVFYDQAMHQKKEREVLLTNAIKPGLVNNEFYIMYQPILDVETNRFDKLEALIRWNHPELGIIPPNDFIYLSEISGSIVELTDFVCQSVFSQMSKWCQEGLNITVAINISPKVLMHPDFIQKMDKLTSTYQIPKENVLIEITESVALERLDISTSILNQLRKNGFVIALDDFGTGYSSLTYLKHLPIDIIKIDRTFVANIDKHTEERHFLKFVMELSHSLNKKVVLEGIETAAQASILKQYHVDFAQGYLFHKPLLVEDLAQVINQKQ